MRYKYLFVAIILCSNIVSNSQINKTGLPFLRNFTSKEYKASGQNWSIIQDKRGILYFGNTEGILEYDGVNWALIPVSNNSIVRSMAINDDGTVFAGAVGEIGYLQPNKTGQIHYVSLLNKLDSSQREFTDVWKTYVENDKVYFCTFSKILCYENDTVISNSLPENSFFSYLLNEHFFVCNTMQGLLLYSNYKETGLKAEINLVKGGESYKGKYIMGISSGNTDGDFIIGTYNHGLYTYELSKGTSTLINNNNETNNASDFLKNNFLFHSTSINKTLLNGTYQKGIMISDNSGKIISVIDKESGLIDETINYVFYTNRGYDDEIWMALSNGIARIEYDLPIRFFKDLTNINDIIYFKDKLYIATDNGVFYITYKNRFKPEFQELKFPLGQSWSFHEFLVPNKTRTNNSKLLVSTGKGVYEIFDDTCTEIIKLYECRLCYQSKYEKNTIFVGHNKGVLKLIYSENKFINKGNLPGFSDIVTCIEEDNKKNIWLGTYYNGVLKLEQNDSNVRRFTIKDGLPSNKENSIYSISDKILASTKDGVYEYDFSNDKFIKSQFLKINKQNLANGIYKIYHNSFNEFWCITQSVEGQGLMHLVPDDIENFINDKSVRRIPLMSFQSIYTDNNNITWIGGADGLFSYDNSIEFNKDSSFNVSIRKVTIATDSVIFEGAFSKKQNGNNIIVPKQQLGQKPILTYINNSISFDCAAQFYQEEISTLYSHRLVGFNDKWTKWKSETKSVFTNLNEGEYKFQIKAKNIYGFESNIAEFNFEVLPPWYRTILAYILYIIFTIFSVWILIKLNTRRLEKEKKLLEKIVRARTAEIVKQKEEIEKAYHNVKMLSEIGKDVTANLTVEKIVETVYHNVNNIMNAPIFAIGLYNKKHESIVFFGKESANGEILRNTDSLNNEKQLSVYCFNSQKEIIINNFSKNNVEYEHFKNYTDESTRESLIYLPLTSKEKKIGIITVQSTKANAYTNNHLNILRNLAVYTAIALDNAEAYRQIGLQKNEIEKQRDIVVKQKQEITDSILYAKRIQTAVLPPVELFTENLPEHFVLFKPRDIVSGDFFWMKKINNFIVITVADCTGHGVPGAFMSMLGIALLNEIVRKKTISTASDVLNELRKQIKLALRQTGKSDEAKDGMDIALCVIDTYSKTFNFAGAYNSLYLFRKLNKSGKPYTTELPTSFSKGNTQLIEIKADKMPIGIHLREKESFTDHKLDILPGDTFYMFSDGYPDQIGGPNRKKFMTKPFKKLLLKIQDKSLSEQKLFLDKTIEDWKEYPDEKGNGYEQMDDITILGIRF